MRRLKCEKETIILTNEDDGFYDVYTFNQSLRAFAEKYPDDCWLKGSSEDGSETYIIKKGRLSLNLRPPYSKDRIHKASPASPYSARSFLGFPHKKLSLSTVLRCARGSLPPYQTAPCSVNFSMSNCCGRV